MALSEAGETYRRLHELSHNFKDYLLERDLITRIKQQIIHERAADGDKKYITLERRFGSAAELPARVHARVYRENTERFLELQKKRYLTWARDKGVPEDQLERGWDIFTSD